MGKKVVGVTIMLAAIGLCGACSEVLTVEIAVVEDVVEDAVVRVGAVTRGGSEVCS